MVSIMVSMLVSMLVSSVQSCGHCHAVCLVRAGRVEFLGIAWPAEFLVKPYWVSLSHFSEVWRCTNSWAGRARPWCAHVLTSVMTTWTGDNKHTELSLSNSWSQQTTNQQVTRSCAVLQSDPTSFRTELTRKRNHSKFACNKFKSFQDTQNFQEVK